MKQLDPKAVWLFFLGSVLRWVFFVVFIFFWAGMMLTESESISFGFLNWLWLLVPAAIVVSFVWAKLTYHFYRYELTEAGFRKESGVIWKRYVTIPYSRIQNVDIYRGILARMLGLSDLQVQTAGASASISRYGAMGMGAEGRLPALAREDAEKLRDELVNRARSERGQGL